MHPSARSSCWGRRGSPARSVVAPDEATLRRVCGQVEGEAFEQAGAGWLPARVRRVRAARARTRPQARQSLA